VAVELNSFRCGHDAAIFAVIEGIVEASGTPFFAFRDLDENKPSGSIKIRLETIHHFLTRHRETIRAEAELTQQLDRAWHPDMVEA
jgi:predicted nucleotide-binding protein (sugar kinase/HSP70/actin superfamily)